MTLWKRIVPLALILVLFSCANAQEEPTSFQAPVLQARSAAPEMIQPAQNPVVEVVRRVREAVVQIRVEAKITVQNPMNSSSMIPSSAISFQSSPALSRGLSLRWAAALSMTTIPKPGKHTS